MATIPIEVIVQDKEVPVDPTPTPETNTTDTTETSVAVPDTGDGTMGSGINGSTSTIIIPAVILVLAIGSIIAILIHRHNKRKADETNIYNDKTRKERRAAIITSTVAILAITVLLGQLLATAVVQPTLTNAATSDNAEGDTEDHIDVADKISIVIERTAEEDEAEAIVESTSTITSTADFGYKVLLAMAEGADAANLYLDGDETSEYYIAPVNNEETEETETAGTNIWGYALEEDGEYSAMPLADDAAIVAKEVATAEGKEIPVYYGVRVSKDLPNGTYVGELTYDLTNYITTMQEMTSDICDAVPTPGNQVTDPVPTATLVDIRDDKTYTIAKLADGNCWMTQNLDLDLEMKAEGSIVYDSTNTNLLTNTTWEPERATIAKDSLSSDTWQMDNNNPYSYDPGDVYYYTSGSDVDDIKYESLEACVGANHTEAECRHYHVGNYYNWTAAIASNDSSEYTEDYQNVTTSICPAGWRLPIISGATLDENEFAVLVDKYGILGDSMPCGPGCNSKYGYAVNGFNSIRLAPIWLVRPGGINRYATIDLFNSGERGFYWSSVVGGSLLSRGFEFSFDDGMRLPGIGSRSKGSSVRCVAE